MITGERIYNVDEKGFLIGIGSAMKRIMTKKAFDQGRVRQAAQNGCREFITVIACVSAAGVAIPPCLLYKSESGDLQDTWVEEVEHSQHVYFGGSANGWSNNAYGLRWLKDVFNLATKPISPRTWRLLIVDGHSSHVNLEFLFAANERKILVLILPPHSTHRLQPLDVTLFLPLATAYSIKLNE
jgi:DDE superfamily endonuclease